MKPRISDLERQARDYDQALLHSEFFLLPLLRLARAAKAHHGEVRTAAIEDEMYAALDAFDWDDQG